MTVEVKPMGTKCSLACEMCYQNPIREAGNQTGPGYSVEKMKKALTEENYHFTLFGGEPLLTPIDDLAELWKFGLEKFGKNGIQTSASCITEKHFELFKKYKVAVGLSLEGPGELNDIRWAGSLERTRRTTTKVELVLRRLLEEKHPLSLITTLNRGNASPERLPRLLDWFRELDAAGLQWVNLHLMEVDSPKVREKWTLSEEQNAAALLECAKLQRELTKIQFQPITDMVGLLLGRDSKSNCTWNACDPYTTRAVRGVNQAGDRVNCSRTNKDGIDFQKADAELLVRPLALYHTDQAAGGCSGCRYWFACKGHCPGESLGGDWRQRTEHCGTLKLVFAELEDWLGRLSFRPISADDARRTTVEKNMLVAFERGYPLRVYQALKGTGPTQKEKGPGDHGDAPHGDTGHGDHTDAANPIVTHGDSWGPDQ